MLSTPAAFVIAALLAIPMTVLAVALIKAAKTAQSLLPAIVQLAHSITAFRVVHAQHRESIDHHALATNELARAQPQPVTLETFELEACGTGCCRGPLPDAQEDTPPLVAATPVASAKEVAASARRKTARDRVDPDSVTPAPESH